MIIAIAAAAILAFAQDSQHTQSPSPYTANAANAVKALSPETLDAYRNGTGMGLAIPAELNGYPGPRHILDLSEQLALSTEQQKKIEAIYAPMHEEAIRLGKEIIDLETKLDRAFGGNTITVESLKAITNEIAVRQGQLRYVHLAAHIAAKNVLTSEQIAIYENLRGYETAGHHHHDGM